MNDAPPYLPNSASHVYQRRLARCVMVGDVGIGGDHPIRIQSMTTPATQDVAATVAQTVRLVEAGCEIVRVTVPTVADARALKAIRSALQHRGIHVPLVADIHFSPAAALEAAHHVEKVRVNPGNYADSKRFVVREYTDAQYAEEVERVAARFVPLVQKCQDLGVAMRIGTNHGSLSDRIMNRYGDTPLGMVESALEFVRICEDYGYHDVVFSMKASNPKVMIQAYRLLAARLDQRGMPYPLHLGVTEAGGGQDGRIKSAIGSGALLDDGLGDTVRVSLTEEPEAEVPAARALVQPYNAWHARSHAERRGAAGTSSTSIGSSAGHGAALLDTRDPYSYARRRSETVRIGSMRWGGADPVRVLHPLRGPLARVLHLERRLRWLRGADGWVQPRADAVVVRVVTEADLTALRRAAVLLHSQPADTQTDAPVMPLVVQAEPAVPWLTEIAAQADALMLPITPISINRPRRDTVSRACRIAAEHGVSVILAAQGVEARPRAGLAWARTLPAAAETLVALLLQSATRARQAGLSNLALALGPRDPSLLVRAGRLAAAQLTQQGWLYPLHFIAWSQGDEAGLLRTSAALGSLLCDGLGDGIQLMAPASKGDGGLVRQAFNLLQGAGVRLSKTDYVACPSCGRTLFDLQTTTARIQAETSHLRGVKIAVMGCIVNGPGEMADADFGYVGGAPGRVNLYVGKTLVERSVPEAKATTRLIEVIRRHGRWTHPPSAAPTALGRSPQGGGPALRG